MNVQSHKKGNLRKIINQLITTAKEKEIYTIGLMPYNRQIKDMYINKFGFIAENNILVRHI